MREIAASLEVKPVFIHGRLMTLAAELTGPFEPPRWTRQRASTVSALEAHDGFLTVQELHARLRGKG
jgi:hypothetical protein